MNNRVHSLDFLRGLMAFMIMVYHYTSWSMGGFWGQRFVVVFGVYGVAIFYVLSGLTLYLVYQDRLKFATLPRYFIKRVLRIFPLLWLAIFLTVFALDKGHSTRTILLNLSGLFGFVDYNNSIAIGSWSIGNELVYYSLFPLVVWLGKRMRFGLELSFLIAVILGGWFAFGRLSPDDTLHNQWGIYVHPFNHLFLFVGGMLLGKYGHYVKGKRTAEVLIGFSLLFYVLYPLPDRVHLATGFTRVIYSCSAMALTLGFYRLKIPLVSGPLKGLSFLGKVSYSVYLLHPIVFFLGAYLVNRRLYPLSYILVSMIATFFVSWIVYEQFEKRFIGLGKKWS